MMRAKSSAATIDLPTRTLSRFRYRRQSIPDPDDVNTDIKNPGIPFPCFPGSVREANDWTLVQLIDDSPYSEPRGFEILPWTSSVFPGLLRELDMKWSWVRKSI